MGSGDGRHFYHAEAQMITGITTKETIHGNPGERRVLPAGLRVRLEPATNLPADSKIRWWAFPLPRAFATAGTAWAPETRQWAEDVGVGLEAEDVGVEWAVVKEWLIHAATAFDGREHDKADRNPRRAHYSPYALPQYLARVDEVVADMARGADPRIAILRGFVGRLGDAMLKALGLPASNKAERCSFAGSKWHYQPVTRPAHNLIIDCRHDAQAHCSCGRWEYTATGAIDMDRVAAEHAAHVTYARP
jgi:hypothetical protein